MNWTRGRAAEQVLEALGRYEREDLDESRGRSWGYAYQAGEAAKAVAAQAYVRFLGKNGLDPTLFPSLLRLENEVVGIVRSRLHGDEQVVGTFTSGGTESILLAVEAALQHYRARRATNSGPGSGGRGELVLSETAHAAFHKAAHYFGLDVRLVPVLEDSLTADPRALRDAVGDETVMLVGSAPSYAHGVIDPIPQLAEIAREREVWLHVDGCIGGWLLGFLVAEDPAIPLFDFRLPGVSSISVDLHKYGYCPKGASVVLYRDKALRRGQLFACATWPGYAVLNPTTQGSKSGGPLAAAWAVLHQIGEDGYARLAREVRGATAQLVEGIDAIEGLRVLGDPRMSLIAFAGEGLDIFELIDDLNERGWYVMAQLGSRCAPASAHLTVTPRNAGQAEAFLADLRELAAAVAGRPADPLAAMLRQAATGLDVTKLDAATFNEMLKMVGVENGRLPRRMARVNRVLEALPPAAREAILLAFFNDAYAPIAPAEGE